jgi:hypothetical protein
MELGSPKQPDISQAFIVNGCDVSGLIIVRHPDHFALRAQRHEGRPIEEKRERVRPGDRPTGKGMG